MVCVRDSISLTWWVVLVAWLGPSAFGELTKQCQSEGLRASGICGKGLANILSMVCSPRGGFSHNIPAEKRDSYLGVTHQGFPFLSKPEALTYLHKRGGEAVKRIGQGVTCECCYHLCSYGEMQEYCVADGPKQPNAVSIRSGVSSLRSLVPREAAGRERRTSMPQVLSPNSPNAQQQQRRDENI